MIFEITRGERERKKKCIPRVLMRNELVQGDMRGFSIFQ